jgi:hypothetical protein
MSGSVAGYELVLNDVVERTVPLAAAAPIASGT